MMLLKLALTLTWIGGPLVAITLLIGNASEKGSDTYEHASTIGAFSLLVLLLACVLYIAHQIVEVWS